MRRHLATIFLLLVLALVAGFFGWALHAAEPMGSGWEGLAGVWLYVLGGLVAVGALTGGLMWLAFYSSRHGYDEPFDVNKPNGGRGDDRR
jgi:hypothetical protein